MKILCQACAAKYTIADEKVVGKVVKIKCKKCGAPIVVNGNDPSAMAAAAAPPDDDDDGGATKVVHQSPMIAEAAPSADEWTVSVTDNDQRTMTSDQIVQSYRAGQIPGDAFCWRDGMADWLPLSNIPELMNLVGSVNGGGARAETAPYPGLQEQHPEAPTLAMSGGAAPGMGSFATTQLGGAQAPMVQAIAAAQQQMAPAPAPAAAARRAGGKGGVDLFGGGAAPAAAGHLPSAVGERNENSVLFSIGALKAAEDSALRGGGRPPPPKGRVVPEARVDDLFSLGPPPAAPMLAPPPMMAPYVEPPPPPPPPPPPAAMQPNPYGGAAAAASMAPMSTGYPIGGGSPYAAPQKKGAPVGLIVGGILGLVVIGGGAAYALTRGGSKPDSKTSDTAEASQSTASTADTSKTAAADTSKPADNAKPQDTSTADSSSDSGKTADTSKPADTSKATTVGTGKLPPGAKTADAVAKNEPTSKPETKPEPPPSQPDPPPAETSKPADNGAAGTAEFDRGAAGAALSAKAGAASGCHKDGDPTGSASVSVTFAPSGHASGVSVGAPFGGTPTGNCIAGIFRSASVPPFSGSPVTVPKHVSVH